NSSESENEFRYCMLGFRSHIVWYFPKFAGRAGSPRCKGRHEEKTALFCLKEMDSGRSLSVRIIAFGAFSAICYFGATAIITVLLAVMVAYLLDPIATFLQRLRIPRALAIAVSMIVAGIIIAAMISLFVDRAQDFSANLPNYKTKIQKVS